MIKYKKCRWCGSEHLALASHLPPHEMKLYCLSCTKTQQWISKKDMQQARLEFAVIEDTEEQLSLHQNVKTKKEVKQKSSNEIFRPRSMRDCQVW